MNYKQLKFVLCKKTLDDHNLFTNEWAYFIRHNYIVPSPDTGVGLLIHQSISAGKKRKLFLVI